MYSKPRGELTKQHRIGSDEVLIYGFVFASASQVLLTLQCGGGGGGDWL